MRKKKKSGERKKENYMKGEGKEWERERKTKRKAIERKKTKRTI